MKLGRAIGIFALTLAIVAATPRLEVVAARDADLLVQLSALAPGPGVGTAAPAAQVRAPDGSAQSIPGEDATLLVFFRTGCRASKQLLARLDRLLARDARLAQALDVMVVSSEAPTILFGSQNDHRYTVYHDPGGVVESAFGVNASPIIFLLDKHGVVLAKWVGAVRIGTRDLLDTAIHLALGSGF